MFINLRKILKSSAYAIYSRAWSFIGIVLLLLYVGGLYLMDIAGESEIVENYTWWFFVTVTTVGYGDYAPGSSFGRAVAIAIMFFGIGIIALIIAKVTDFIIHSISKRNKGEASVSESDILIMGYRKNSTEKVVKELLSDHPEARITLCSSDQEENPFSQQNITFIKGELASRDVIERCAASTAQKIIIHGSDDNQTFFTAYAVREVNQRAHLVCYLQNEEHANKIHNLSADTHALNQVILPVNVYLMAQELQDPESSDVFQHLISNLNGATLFRTDIPTADTNSAQMWSFKDMFMHFKEKHHATIVAIKGTEIISNPGLDEDVGEGYALFYIAAKRIVGINWNSITSL